MHYALIEVFTSETAQYRGGPVYHAVAEAVRRQRIAARVHVYRGIAGAFEGGRLTSWNLLDLSANLPVKIEILLPAGQVEAVLPLLGEIVTDGAVAVRPLDVRHHRTPHGLLPRDLRVADVMTPDPVAVVPDTPAPEILRILLERGFRGVPVVSAGRRVVGVVTEEDLVTRGGLPVRPGLLARPGAGGGAGAAAPPALSRMAARDLMTAPAVTVPATVFLAVAVRIMVAHRHRTLPVVDAEGRLTGMLSRLDVLRVAARWARTLEQWPGAAPGPGARLVQEAVAGPERCVRPEAPLSEVTAALVQSGVRRVAVTGAGGHLLGVVAEHDLLQAVGERAHARTAAGVMSQNVVSARADEPLALAVARMVEHGLKELPVVDDQGRFAGFLSRRALLGALAQPEPEDENCTW